MSDLPIHVGRPAALYAEGPMFLRNNFMSPAKWGSEAEAEVWGRRLLQCFEGLCLELGLRAIVHWDAGLVVGPKTMIRDANQQKMEELLNEAHTITLKAQRESLHANPTKADPAH